MALNPAQQAAVAAFRQKLSTASSADVRQEAFKQIVQTIREQQDDQRTAEVGQLVAAVKADPTWADLATILWAELQLRL